ncbi:hypothetical protein AB835_09860 [Candidatus Endobugula sertula]|uniref:Fatty acid hydroxylase domain-containing protein n=1 Tax=Candidatus Endobugula sertula TaxID=62101 RepID=A0A1D2QNV7_9GAMM|nr:hypothetical protein AB835_09860 [Candidatus Endobugula sertula]
MITDLITDLLNTFFNPEKRVFVGYLLSATLLALSWLMWIERQGLQASLKKIFSLSIWWSTSAKADYKIFFINKMVLILLSPLLITQLTVATLIFYQWHEWFPSRPQWFVSWPDWLIAVMFTSSYFLLDDFMRFYVHRLLHQWSLLWAFHKVHHTAQTLTPFTVFRTHPVELVIFSLRSIFVQALAIGSFVFFVGEKVDLITVLGANAIIFVFNLLGSNIRHSHIAIHYWKPLEKIFISPAQHQIHHSLKACHHNKNYGVVLAVWDYFTGTHHHSEKNQLLVFGVNEPSVEPDQLHSLWGMYGVPVSAFFVSLNNIVKKMLDFEGKREKIPRFSFVFSDSNE